MVNNRVINNCSRRVKKIGLGMMQVFRLEAT